MCWVVRYLHVESWSVSLFSETKSLTLLLKKLIFRSILYSISEIKILTFWTFCPVCYVLMLHEKKFEKKRNETFLKTNWKHWLFQIQFTNTKILNFTEKSFLVLLYLIVLATSYFWEQSLLRIRDCSYWKFYFIDCGDL